MQRLKPRRTHKAKRWLWLNLAVSLLLPFSAHAQDEAVGDWLGALDVGGQKLRLVFHITRDESGGWSSTFDSPDQGARGIPTGSTAVEGAKLSIEIPAIGGLYEGTLDEEATRIEGTWKQSGIELPLTLEKTTEEVVPLARPQEPKEPFPYQVVEVTFPNAEAGIELAGTLTLPDDEGPFPGVVLVSGSGPQNRNEELLGHKPFLVLSDYLTRRGIAVLRYDDRGVGESEGDFAAATSADFATDAHGAVRFLRARPEVDASQVGIVGHSEGGLIAPIVAGETTDVSFIVLMGGPGLTGEEILVLQSELIARAGGASDELIERSLAVQKRVFETVRDAGDGSGDLASEVESLLRARYDAMSEEDRAASGIAPGSDPEALIKQEAAQVTSPWFRHFLTYDPVPALERVTQPTLAIAGGNDLQVPPEQNMAAIAAAFEKSGNENLEIAVLEGLNHLFQESATGSPSEYAQIEETFSPKAMEKIASWILTVTKESPGSG